MASEGQISPKTDEDDEEENLWYRDSERDKAHDGGENWFDGDDPEDIEMENMIVLADGHESGGRAIVLDVFTGNIYEDVLECSSKSEMPVEDYFGRLTAMFENLEMVPVPGDSLLEGKLYGDMDGIQEVDDESYAESLVGSKENAAQQYRRIYRSFGWPTGAYNEEGALAAVKAHAWPRNSAMDSGDEEEAEKSSHVCVPSLE